jgi:hypothetical protein
MMGRRLHTWLPGDRGAHALSGTFVVVGVIPAGQRVIVLTAGRRVIDVVAGGTWLNAAVRTGDVRAAVRARARRRLGRV